MKNGYERFNLRSKIDYKAKDWLTIGGNVILSNAVQYKEQGNAWNLAYFAVPVMPIYDDSNVNAWPDKYANAQDLGYRQGQNPLPTLKLNEDRLKIMKLLGNFYMEVNLIPQKLTFKTTYNQSYTSLDQRIVNLPYFIGNSFQLPDAKVNKTSKIYSNQTWDNVLTFTNSFGNHHVVAMVGSSFRDEAYNLLGASGLNFPIDQQQSWYISQAKTIVVGDVQDDATRQYGLSYFGRLTYNFNDKYLLYGTMRADGSSKYQQKWGYFPTIGAGWVLSEETFMKNISAINFLKLRASWGQLAVMIKYRLVMALQRLLLLPQPLIMFLFRELPSPILFHRLNGRLQKKQMLVLHPSC